MPRVKVQSARWAPIALAFALALAAGCQTSVNPVTGRRQVVLMTEEDERTIDAEASRQIEAQMGLVRDPEVVAYVERIGREMAVHSPRQDVIYSFQIVEMDEPNAFALPGGHIYVSRGLLVLANSETEIANVLGHEIGHVAARHAAQQDAHAKTLGFSTLLGDILSGGSEDTADSERISGHFIARYARGQEREADRIGQEMAIAAGVDPIGMAEFLHSLDDLSKLTVGFSSPQSYYATHPALTERVAEATASAETRALRAASRGAGGDGASSFDAALSRDTYLDHVDGIAVGRPATEGVFLEHHFMHPDMGFGLRFPPGWLLINQTTQVMGVAPKRDGVVLLQLQGDGDDPEQAAVEFSVREGVRLERARSVRIGGLPAFRAEALMDSALGQIAAEISWIAFEGRIYRLVAGVRSGAFRKYQGLFRRFAQSFRPLTAEDRARITELRLRSAYALEGETITEFSRRTENEWDPGHTAVINGLFVDEVLRAGQRLKIAVREPYESPEGAVSGTDGRASPPSDEGEPAGDPGPPS
jgi:predicted Zn-dependent protease